MVEGGSGEVLRVRFEEERIEARIGENRFRERIGGEVTPVAASADLFLWLHGLRLRAEDPVEVSIDGKTSDEIRDVAGLNLALLKAVLIDRIPSEEVSSSARCA